MPRELLQPAPSHSVNVRLRMCYFPFFGAFFDTKAQNQVTPWDGRRRAQPSVRKRGSSIPGKPLIGTARCVGHNNKDISLLRELPRVVRCVSQTRVNALLFWEAFGAYQLTKAHKRNGMAWHRHSTKLWECRPVCMRLVLRTHRERGCFANTVLVPSYRYCKPRKS